MYRTGNEKYFLPSRNFPQEEIHETKFHLTSFFFVPMKKKWLPNITITESFWVEQVSTEWPDGNVLESS